MRIVTVVGARPQFVKAAVLTRPLREASIKQILVHTGQHHDPEMSEIFFADLDLPTPDHNLNIHGGSHGAMTGRMMEKLEPLIADANADFILVFGDTNSTLAGALTAAKLNIPIAHVEAGLRSYNRRMPEEINRVVTDHLSGLLFCPTHVAVENLRKEGIYQNVHFVGDVMYDIALQFASRIGTVSEVLTRVGLDGKCFGLVTLHRAENVDNAQRIHEIVAYLKQAAAELPLILPLHPRTREAIKRHDVELDPIIAVEPLSYPAILTLLKQCSTVYTDSGGLQKEAYFFRKPCVTLRDETEWTETIECGWNRLWRDAAYKPRREVQAYGNGDAGTRIVELLHAAKGMG